MKSYFSISVCLGTLVARCLAVTVTVSKTASHSVPSTLYGQMFEVHTTAALTAWHPINNAKLVVIADPNPVSNALPNSLQFSVPSGATGQVGFSNEGFWGINVNSSWTYNASFFFRFPTASGFSGALTVGLQTSSGKVLAQTSTQVHGSTTKWTQVNLKLRPTASASDVNNSFFVTIDGAAAAGQTINFALFSLFPPTFKNRPNGMRIDIAETLAEMGPAFFRFPGGNNLFFEDVGMEPIMAVWAGYSLGGTSLAENQLAPYIQQAKDQINFVIGNPAESAPAALRASLGHPEPFQLRFVEVGNEDFFAANTYTYRWNDFVSALQAEFPQIRFIATTDAWDPILSPVPQSYDVHVYQTPTWFFQNAFYYDDFQRNGTTYFEGEYAAISTNANDIFGTPADGRLTFPTMQSASGEAAFMTGLERNSDIVFAASYAPLLQHVNSTQWLLLCPDPGFDLIRLFSLNRGDQYLPSTLPTRGDTLHWSITRSSSSGQTFIKVANAGSSAESITFQLNQFGSVASAGTLQLLTGAETASNTPDAPETIVPKTSTIRTGKSFTYDAPAFSVSVITVTTH
ncbi:hypothetical protein BN946_scf184748.g21 [Trametes cinnabarina]|uniref:non-reducing end alpha-L-arabinofuranosidase n=1 Tax=Pycnoporus cinnabarinus TaxID=5643 RepID=A0A060SE04_PYCCI|nr:hypothetical protein BN946_scf184748.g21 [Trametes cinnabarina]